MGEQEKGVLELLCSALLIALVTINTLVTWMLKDSERKRRKRRKRFLRK